MPKDKKSKKKSLFDKYEFYENSVQNTEVEIDFLNEQFLALRGKKPLVLREDFGGTGLLACDWVKQSPQHSATAIDLDPEPITWGKERHFQALKESEKERMLYLQENVLEAKANKNDIVVAFNFSYFIFKKRKELLEYFKKIKGALGPDGVFFIDAFGGTEAHMVLEEKSKHPGFTYFWDCQYFNPLTYHTRYSIHYKIKGEKKRKNVFTYDWRLWSIPELKDLLTDAGFSQVRTYWEGDDNRGGGDGIFKITEEAENCESWVTYLAAFN